MMKKLRGFTLTELVIAMILFGIVMAVSGVSVSMVMNILHSQTDQETVMTTGNGAMEFLETQIRYCHNATFSKSPITPENDDCHIIKISDGKISRDGVELFFDSRSAISVTSEIQSNDTVKFSMVIGNKGKRLFTKTETVHTKQDGALIENADSISEDEEYPITFEGVYYICIDERDPSKSGEAHD